MFNKKTILIVAAIIILAFIGYAIAISGKKDSSAGGVTKQAVGTTSKTSTAGVTTTKAAGLDGPGKEFVTQLLAIQNIKFNLSIFSDPVFQGLQDWSREILPQETGRPNPFAPLETDLVNGKTTSGTGFNGNIGSITPESDGSGAAESTSAPASTRPASTRTR
ncbi:MAG: hypothetical protein KBB54_01760 [Candidatus Pacebacteria bacterium]|nr:hypothetical protein [Candidatus Paceibacterota bacterium]MBP9818989.1 hypothetical protein [Candidatus Paceibacterota bacterium]